MSRVVNIVITGPESTGKSTLAEQLACHFKTVYIPEYAREYICNLHRPYTFSDIDHIAKKQVEQKQLFQKKANKLLFLDTYLIVTKVWFQEVYHQYPAWIDDAIRESDIKMFLLCDTDLPWIPDEVRENGGERRNYLFKRYVEELKYYGLSYRIIRGQNELRLQNAISLVNEIVDEQA